MFAAVDDVHHRHRQGARRDAADIAIERQAARIGGGLRGGEADAEDRIGAEAALVRRAVEVDHRLVEFALVLGIEADQRLGDIAVHGGYRLDDTLAEIARLVAIAQLERLLRAGRGARRNPGPAEASVFQPHTHIHRWVAAPFADVPA